jgi:hypothetical protein
MNEAELKARALSALEAFQQADQYLLEFEHDLSERCIAARVAFHLQNILSDCPALSVDVEHNRKGIEERRNSDEA